MFKIIFVIKRATMLSVCLISGFAACAQKQNVYYFKNDGKKVASRDSADYTRIISEPDSGTTLYNIKEYFKNRKPKLIGQTSTIDPPTLQGQCVSFYPSGKRKELAIYKNNKLNGEVFDYYQNGILYFEKEYSDGPDAKNNNSVGDQPLHCLIKACRDSTGKDLVVDGNGHYIGYSEDFTIIFEHGDVKNGERTGLWTGAEGGKSTFKFEEQYVDGKLTSGTGTDSTGKTYTYMQREVNPEYPGGDLGFMRYLMQNVRYPLSAKQKNIQGKVFIKFVIERDGKLTDIQIVHDPGSGLGAEGVRVIKLSPPWVPGSRFGRPIRVEYAVPLVFSLGER